MNESPTGPGAMTADMVYVPAPDEIRGCLGCGLAYVAGSEELHGLVHELFDRAIREGWLNEPHSHL